MSTCTSHPMPRPRFEKASPELKASVLGAARKEFARAGYEGASLNRMLEAAGLSKGAFYYYFDDKADLAIACFQDVFGPMVEMSLPPDPKDVTDFWEAVRVMSYRMLDYVESSTEKFELVSKLAAALVREPELSKRLTPLVSEVTQRMMKLWMRGQELGAVRTDIPLPAQMSVLQGIKEGLSRVMAPRDSTLTPEELHHIVELQLDLFQRVCSPAPVSRP